VAEVANKISANSAKIAREQALKETAAPDFSHVRPRFNNSAVQRFNRFDRIYA
jgi:hypothetical protein